MRDTNRITKENVERLMKKHHVPKGSDDPEVQALGAPPLHYLEDEDDD